MTRSFKATLLVIALVFMAAILLITNFDLNRENSEESFHNLDLGHLSDEVESTLKIAFVGDIMLDRYVRQKNSLDNYQSVLSVELADYLNSFDLVVANLEGSISRFASVADYNQNNPDHYRFTFDPAVLPALKENFNLGAVSLGNNHILDFGPEALEQTKVFLEEFGIGYFGDPLKEEVDFFTLTKEGVEVSFVAYNYADSILLQSILERISKLNQTSNHVVVFAHWGEEYSLTESQAQRDLARDFIEVGADLIIGAHPHVIQSNEKYQDKHIFYSLGNFVFDQYFSEEVRCGQIVSFTFSKENIELDQVKNNYLERDGTTSLLSCF